MTSGLVTSLSESFLRLFLSFFFFSFFLFAFLLSSPSLEEGEPGLPSEACWLWCGVRGSDFFLEDLEDLPLPLLREDSNDDTLLRTAWCVKREQEILTWTGGRVRVSLQQVGGAGGGLPAAHSPRPDVLGVVLVVHGRPSLLYYQ